jgi:hypothetical protein
MSNTNLNTVAPTSTIANSNASLNLDALGGKAKIVVSNTTAVAGVKPFDKLVTMEESRISWETTELAASNNRLYSILYQAYKFYLVMKKDSDADVRKSQFDAMEKFVAARGYTFTPSTHDMTRVVKCVFGVERRRVSAYSIALREALRQEVVAEDLVAFLEDNGGVEQIRLGGTKPLSATKRAEQVKEVVLTNELGKIRCDVQADADWTDKQVVIVATYLPTGEFVANAVVKHDGAVNAALAAYYSQQMAKVRADAKAERDAIKLAEQTFKNGERQKNKEAKEYLKNSKAPKKKMSKEEKIAFAKLEIERIADRQAIIDKLFEYIE